MVDRPFDRKERLAQSVVDPVVGGPPQTQPLPGDIAFGQRGLAAMIEANMPVDVQGAGQFRRGLQPVSGQEPGPFFFEVALFDSPRSDHRAVLLGM